VDLLIAMVEHHAWLVGELIDRAESLDPARLEAPITCSVEGIDDDPTLRTLLARLAGQMAMWESSIDSVPYDLAAERALTMPQIRAVYEVAGPRFVALVRRLAADNAFENTFVDSSCDPPRSFSYGGMVAHVLTFAAARRTLVCGALSSAGVTDLGAGDPMWWVTERRHR
jgi:AraC family transcriptional regulator